MNRIFLKKYGPPTVIFTIACLVFQWSNSLLETMQSSGDYFSVLFADSIFKYLPLMATAVAIGCFVWLLSATYTLWKIEQGELHIYDECCPRCGAITIRKIGQYGAYMKCLTCEKNTGI